MEESRVVMGYDDPEGILDEIFGTHEHFGVDNDPAIENAVDTWLKSGLSNLSDPIS